MVNKVLFVDDESSILDGYKRMLHREFEVDTAVGGLQGLTLIRDRGPFSVVISDMRMPGMNGAQFLAQVRQSAPDTVRMLLTGYTDIDAAMDAVNRGNIFRFLAKPCEKETMIEAINAGIYQYRLVMVEKELLEDTLMGSIKVMTDVLSAASPEAFGRSMRITRYVRHVIGKFNPAFTVAFRDCGHALAVGLRHARPRSHAGGLRSENASRRKIRLASQRIRKWRKTFLPIFLEWNLSHG